MIGKRDNSEGQNGPFTRIKVGSISVHGKPVDHETRCEHYHTETDVIAIRFKCCDQYFPCYFCHEETVSHPAKVWPTGEFDEKAVLCGACGHEMTINEYFQSGNHCPSCNHDFNPGCALHYHLYFEKI